MKKISLKWQLALVAMMPFVFFAAISLVNAMRAIEEYRSATTSSLNLLVVSSVSAIVHESQIERGKTAAYLAGGITLEELNKQRDLTDSKIHDTLTKLEASAMTLEQKSKVQQTLDSYVPLRAGISAKTTKVNEAIAGYSKIIADLLKSQLVAGTDTKIAEVRAAVRSWAVLEDSKESAGKLRANMTSALTENGPLDDTRFQAIAMLKGRADASLTSPSLLVSPETAALIADFPTKKEWQEVGRVYTVVVTHASLGHYDIEPKQFFATITTAINFLREIVNSQLTYAEACAEKARSKAISSLWTTSLWLLGTMIFLGWFTSSVTFRISKGLRSLVTELTEGSTELADTARRIAGSSTQLSNVTSEQATALGETAASIDQITAMVGRNSEAAKHSTDVAGESQNASNRGKETVGKMIDLVGRINDRTGEIMTQVRDGNGKISDITRVIAEIGKKTAVINDIVFQTKLLSFNASVEAARAGEHGKGFSVVAEEIGSLAQMSGNAAREISDLLAGSITQVQSIVQQTGSRMESLVSASEVETRAATNAANECGAALDKIIVSSSQMTNMVKQIATSSTEQLTGVSEISSAMNQINRATQKNKEVADQSSSAAVDLSVQAEKLRFAVRSLQELVDGGNAAPLDDSYLAGPKTLTRTQSKKSGPVARKAG